MYSGVTGEEFEVDIFIGARLACFSAAGDCLTCLLVGNVFYQRLRHMVSDKFQVRTTGPVNSVTRQPVKVEPPKAQWRPVPSLMPGWGCSVGS